MTTVSAAGKLQVVGHISPWAQAGVPAGTANAIIHFPDGKSVADLDFLTQGLLASKRTGAATAMICVLGPDQLGEVHPRDGLTFADDAPGWERLLKVKKRPETFVLNPSGAVVWHHEGGLTAAGLGAALREHLAADGVFRPRFLELPLSVGQRAPNFLFGYAPDGELTLRKLMGRQVALVFWKSSSKPSLETVIDLQRIFAVAGAQGPVVLAINGGEDPALAKRTAAENEISAVVVPDPKRQITLAYGVTIWPTAIFLDTYGIVEEIRYGLISGPAKPERRSR